MSTRQLRARLDRLEQSAKRITEKSKDRSFDFSIDPALANALRDDRKRLDELERARPDFMSRWRTNAPDSPEERMLRERIAERAKTISCPAGYGFNEVWDDRVRLLARQNDEELPPWIAHLTPLDDVEEAQAMARIEAFDQSPEGRARARIRELGQKWRKTPAEHSELDGLLTRYPEPHCHPKDPMRGSYAAWAPTARGNAEEARISFVRANLFPIP